MKIEPYSPDDRVADDGFVYFCDECGWHYANEWDITRSYFSVIEKL